MLNTWIWTLSPPNDIAAVIRIAFSIIFIFKVIIFLIPWVISRKQDNSVVSNIGNLILVWIKAVIRVKIVTTPRSKNSVFKLSIILSEKILPIGRLLSSFFISFLFNSLLPFFLNIIPTSNPPKMCDIKIM